MPADKRVLGPAYNFYWKRGQNNYDACTEHFIPGIYWLIDSRPKRNRNARGNPVVLPAARARRSDAGKRRRPQAASSDGE